MVDRNTAPGLRNDGQCPPIHDTRIVAVPANILDVCQLRAGGFVFHRRHFRLNRVQSHRRSGLHQDISDGQTEATTDGGEQLGGHFLTSAFEFGEVTGTDGSDLRQLTEGESVAVADVTQGSAQGLTQQGLSPLVVCGGLTSVSGRGGRRCVVHHQFI